MTTLLGRLTAGLASKINLAADLLAVSGALVASAAIAGTGRLHLGAPFAWLVLACIAIWTIAATVLRHYDPNALEREPMDDAALVSVLVLSSVTVLATASLLLPRGTVPPVSTFLLLDWPMALVMRGLFRGAGAREEEPLDDVLIVGTGALARHTAEDLAARGRRRVIGFLQLHGEPRSCELALRRKLGASVRVLGPATDLERILRDTPVGEVYVAADARKHGEQIQTSIKICERLGVPFALPAHCYRLERARPVDPRAIGDGYLHYLAVDVKPHQMALKRLFDIVAAAAALWILGPLFLAVAAAIKLTSRGPVFFKQIRVGLHGRPFNMLKFRSMVVNAEAMKARLAAANEMTGPVFKMKRDPRVTAVGRFIRKYSIDELPQLINVLRGEMSVVGPRPPVPSEVAKYQAWQLRRLSVRPGLTCIWQVSGRNQISFEQWMYLDLRYIDTWTLLQDFQLIARTVPVVVTGRGAS
jgi:exopolysaccharide biosynthesis polyprenyl glycosylphosphotransferase